jgi:calpain-15
VGDCYFLSAIASLATNKDRILRLFSSHEISPVGIYMSKLMFKGIIREVVIDDYFPIYIDEHKKQQYLGCRPHPSNQ